MLHWWSV